MENVHSLTHLAIILAAAFIGGALFRRLNQPVLVGYIIVGILLGPSMAGLVERREDVSLLAELGILLLLFIAGMELDLKSFRSVTKLAVGTCALQTALGVGTMAVLGLILDWPAERAILLGFAVTLSSTAVALKILEDMNLQSTRTGQACLGVLIAQDLAVIPMILIIGAMNGEGGIDLSGVIRLIGGVAVMGLVIYLLSIKPEFLRSVWEQFEKLKKSAMTDQAAITGLAFCFAAAALSGTLGLSAAYGAFLAGLVIGHTMSRTELHEHTKPIFDVLIMVFFLSVGLLIDLQFLREHWETSIAILFLTMLLKTFANYFILKALGMEKEEALVAGAVLGQVGEFSFILAAMGLEGNAVTGDAYKYIVAVISLSLLLSPLWLYVMNRFHWINKINMPPLVWRRGNGENQKNS